MNISKRAAALVGGTALLLAVSATTGAVAGDLIRSKDIADGAVHGVDLSKGVNDKLNRTGEQGPQGEQGPAGPVGPAGPAGADGQDGKDAQALPYGVAQVKVQRGTGAASPWAVYSTTVGSPVGDTTGGTFRFTCSDAQAPCQVSAAGYSTKDGVKVYPRVEIMTESLNGGPQSFCEYGDGPMSDALTGEAAALKLNIGGSADCGLDGPAGDVDAITVPAGYYDVTSTFQFVG